jgi:hypothetical protein
MEGGRFELPNPKERIYSPPRLATSLPLHERKKINMAEEEGFEPPRALTPLSVFKTDPFSRTWVFLRVVGLFLFEIAALCVVMLAVASQNLRKDLLLRCRFAKILNGG